MGTKTISRAKVVDSRGRRTRPPKLIEIQSVDDIPAFANDEEAADFWDTHGPGKHFFETVEPVTDHGLPPPRPREAPTAVRFNADILKRMKSLASRRGVGYQTLLKQFVVERLYEEEKRDGIIS